MNAIFLVICITAACISLVRAPESFLSALLAGASKSAVLCFSLIATYAVWLGLMNVWKDSGVTRCVSRLVRPLAKKLIRTDDLQTLDCLCMNLSVNLLGISGAATPYGIRVAKRLDALEHAEYASAMFFVLNATSIQLIPTSVIGVRAALGSVAPASIVLPTLLTSAFSTLLGCLLVRLFIRDGVKKPAPINATMVRLKQKSKGAGI